MSKFTKIPIEVEAVRLKDPVFIETLEGNMLARVGDWLVTGIDGEKYPIKHRIFIKTFIPTGEDKCNYCLYKTLHKCNCNAPCDKNGGNCVFEWNNWEW